MHIWRYLPPYCMHVWRYLPPYCMHVWRYLAPFVHARREIHPAPYLLDGQYCVHPISPSHSLPLWAGAKKLCKPLTLTLSPKLSVGRRRKAATHRRCRGQEPRQRRQGRRQGRQGPRQGKVPASQGPGAGAQVRWCLRFIREIGGKLADAIGRKTRSQSSSAPSHLMDVALLEASSHVPARHQLTCNATRAVFEARLSSSSSSPCCEASTRLQFVATLLKLQHFLLRVVYGASSHVHRSGVCRARSLGGSGKGKGKG